MVQVIGQRSHGGQGTSGQSSTYNAYIARKVHKQVGSGAAVTARQWKKDTDRLVGTSSGLAPVNLTHISLHIFPQSPQALVSTRWLVGTKIAVKICILL